MNSTTCCERPRTCPHTARLRARQLTRPTREESRTIQAAFKSSRPALLFAAYRGVGMHGYLSELSPGFFLLDEASKHIVSTGKLRKQHGAQRNGLQL